MVELDRIFESLVKAVNECYENAFPDLCQYPKFSLTRAMIILWKQKVHAKIGANLLDAFTQLIQEKRSFEIKAGKLMTEKKSIHSLQAITETGLFQTLEKCDGVLANEILGSNNIELIATFVQSMADLSINEMSVHYLGSKKLMLRGAYKELEDLICKQTK